MRRRLRHGGSLFGQRGLALLALLALGAVMLLAPAAANASDLIDRNASDVNLAVNGKGQALMTYHAEGKLRHVLAWGAINARAPSRTEPQVSFELDYSGGWGKFHREIWRDFNDACRAYDGPPLRWLLTACTAPDGSYWALQSWQRQLPNVGMKPTPFQGKWEMRLSHWRGPLAVMTIRLDWAYRQYDHLYGSLTYLGRPVYGFHSSSSGYVLDGYGRNIFVDTYNSAYGPGWKRENSFLTHNPGGAFCYGFYPGQSNSNRPAGRGQAYRATVIGPGVTPDVFWQGQARGSYDRELDLVANDEQRDLFTGDTACRPN